MPLYSEDIEAYLKERIKSGKEHIQSLSRKHEQNISEGLSYALCDEDMRIYSYTLGALMAREDLLEKIQRQMQITQEYTKSSDSTKKS